MNVIYTQDNQGQWQAKADGQTIARAGSFKCVAELVRLYEEKDVPDTEKTDRLPEPETA